MKIKKFVIGYTDKNFVRKHDIVYAHSPSAVLNHYSRYTGIILSSASLSSWAGEISSTIDLSNGALSLRGCNLSNAVLCDLDFSGVDFSGAILEKADFTFSTMRGCILNGAQCSRAKFYEVDFSGAILDYADFSFSNCDFAVFKGASMREVNFSNVTCYYGNLSGSEIIGTNFQNARFYASTFSGVYLEDINTERTDFSNVKMNFSKFSKC